MSFIETEKLTKTYTMGGKVVTALDNVDLNIEEGEFLIILGPSGSGKTTLLLLLSALTKPTKGRIVVNGLEISRFSPSKAALWRRNNIGFIFQKFHLIDFLNSLENVMIPLYTTEISFRELTDKALILLERVGLKNRLKHKPSQLSGGEQQRVAIARALMADPIIVFADEPTAQLDLKTGRQILSLIREIHDERKTTFVVATHDREIIEIADRTLNVRGGKIS